MVFSLIQTRSFTDQPYPARSNVAATASLSASGRVSAYLRVMPMSRCPRITCTRSNATPWSRRVVAHVSRSRCCSRCRRPYSMTLPAALGRCYFSIGSMSCKLLCCNSFSNLRQHDLQLLSGDPAKNRIHTDDQRLNINRMSAARVWSGVSRRDCSKAALALLRPAADL